MAYRLPDVLIRDRRTSGLLISLVFVAVCAFGTCRARQLQRAVEGHGVDRCEHRSEP
jgi:hypothetical protein